MPAACYPLHRSLPPPTSNSMDTQRISRSGCPIAGTGLLIAAANAGRAQYVAYSGMKTELIANVMLARGLSEFRQARDRCRENLADCARQRCRLYQKFARALQRTDVLRMHGYQKS